LTRAPLSARRWHSLVQHDAAPDRSAGIQTREYDVFISHASEDKDSIVRPLAHALRDGGLNVWYDEFELRIGDSLRQKIDAGLAKSRFGVVVLSRAFFRKGWTNYELDGLVTRSTSGEQVILPIWHEITKKELIDYSPSLADKVARSTGMHTVEEIAQEIVGVIRAAFCPA
jgi:TIR domain